MRRIGAWLALAFLLAGCTTPGRSTGDDERPSRPVQRADCVVSDPQGEVILHPGTLAPGHRTEVLGAGLLGERNLAIIEASAVPFSGSPQVHGIIRDYPPKKNAGIADSLADWDTRRPLAGLRIGPADGQQAVLVAVRLVDARSPGRVKGVRVSTRAADGTRQDELAQPVLVLPHSGRCDVAAYDSTTAWTD
ncbi:MAG TPA: hypothetical protein VNS81_03985 [Nocardioides sp.]|nr:hypothetical protein [Nocardioides sp.]